MFTCHIIKQSIGKVRSDSPEIHVSGPANRGISVCADVFIVFFFLKFRGDIYSFSCLCETTESLSKWFAR